VKHECPRCEQLRVKALEATRAYHALLAQLESAHIKHEDHMTYALRLQLEEALRFRNIAIDELCRHEQTHQTSKSTSA